MNSNSNITLERSNLAIKVAGEAMTIEVLKSRADLSMEVAGDSMAPAFPNGSKILLKRIDEKVFIDWGSTFVLDTCNGAVMKILSPSNKEGHVRCTSINPTYPPFDMCLDHVKGIYRVTACMSLK